MDDRDRNPHRNRNAFRGPNPRRPAARVGSDMGYIGDGNYSSGDYGSDSPNDSDYAGFKGATAIAEDFGGDQYADGRYGQGPFEQSPQSGGDGRFAQSEYSGASDWRSAPDFADPSGYQVFRVGESGERFARRGPKGYRRSDERILEDIYERLLTAHHIDTSDVRIEVQDGVATLTGTVPQRRMKHFIEDLVHDSRDVRDVDNRIRVQSQRNER